MLATHLKDENKQRLPITSRSMPGERIVNGNLYGLHTGSGELLWTQPLANQQLRTNQPTAVPLVIACNRFQRIVQMKNNSRRHETHLLLKCIDTRNGQVLHEASSKSNYRANYLFATDPASEIATLTTVAEVVEFHPLDE